MRNVVRETKKAGLAVRLFAWRDLFRQSAHEVKTKVAIVAFLVDILAADVTAV